MTKQLTKIILPLVLLAFANNVAMAQKYMTKSGVTEFQASVDTFEPVEATNENTTAVLDASNNQVAALIFIRSFHFKVALMEEHFNENYMDTDVHPKATFKGNLEGLDISKLTAEPQAIPVSGVLTIKGKDKNVTTEMMISKRGEAILVTGVFSVSPADFDIEIPNIVREKIAEQILIKINYELKKK